MATDLASVLKLSEEIQNITRRLENGSSALKETSRQQLIKYAERLAIAARTPEENIYYQATQTAQNSAIRTSIGMGVFEKVPLGSSISSIKLAQSLCVDERLLDELMRKVRTMRACTSTHLFEETSSMHYEHNPLSAAFLERANRDMFQQMYDFVGKGVYNMPYFLESTKYLNPVDTRKSAFQYGHQTDLSFWEFLKEDPRRASLFNSGMRSATTVGSGAGSAGPYPFGQELDQEEVSDSSVLVVDVGGGRGQALEAIKSAFPNLKGRMVLQDMHDVIGDAKATGLPDYIETLACSFFEQQPVVGASIYYFRRVFHDWPEDEALKILRNTRLAMGPRSRVLIMDTVVPEVGAYRHMALQDINMMCFAGMERTRLQWEELLTKAELRIKRFWARDSNLQQVIEATL